MVVTVPSCTGLADVAGTLTGETHFTLGVIYIYVFPSKRKYADILDPLF